MSYHIAHKGDRHYWPEPPTESEIKNYKASGGPEDGLTVDNFHLDFSHKPLFNSVWNKRATDIVVEQYCLSYKTEEPGEIQKEFLKLLDQIRKDYHQYVKSNNVGLAGPAQDHTSVAAKCQRRQRRIDTVGLLYLFYTLFKWLMLQ